MHATGGETSSELNPCSTHRSVIWLSLCISMQTGNEEKLHLLHLEAHGCLKDETEVLWSIGKEQLLQSPTTNVGQNQFQRWTQAPNIHLPLFVPTVNFCIHTARKYLHNNNVHLSCTHQHPERSHDTY